MNMIGPYQSVRGNIATTRGRPHQEEEEEDDDDIFFKICLLTVLVWHVLFSYILLVVIYSHHSL